jgi:Cu/Ag efflux protein CusF
MKSLPLVTAVLIGVVAMPALTQTAKPPAQAAGLAGVGPGAAAAGEVVTVTAAVTAVDKASRTVTLKGPQGNTFRVVAGPEVRNFDQIKVGDELIVTHVEALTLELKKGGSGIRERVESETGGRAAAGDKPGAAAVRRVTVVADVVAVNARAQTVTLRGPQHTVDLRVKDPAQLAAIKVGDQVEATYTEGIAISLAAPAKK